MPIPHCKIKQYQGQDRMPLNKYTSPIEMLSNKIYPDKPWNLEFKRTLINVIKEVHEFKGDINELIGLLE